MDVATLHESADFSGGVFGMSDSGDVTGLLEDLGRGNAEALDRLIPLVYEHLHALAQRQMFGEKPGHTLQPTALVHEAFLKLADQRNADWKNRAHFFAVASQVIRRILVDHARGKGRAKRGGAHCRVMLDAELVSAYEKDVDLIALDDALDQLASSSEQQAKIVQMRFFGGLTVKEAAEAIGVSESTIEREWRFARAWLFRRIGGDDGPAAQG